MERISSKSRNFALKTKLMKETHLFFAPEIERTAMLPEEEATHALRVLRMQEGDPIWVTDGGGHFFDCTISLIESGKRPRCLLNIDRKREWQRPWKSDIRLAVAPTKNMDRIEWFVEKATEIGLDGFHFVECANSERRVLKTERVEKIAVSATKQSQKAVKPAVEELTKLKTFLSQPFEGDKFIAHCYEQTDISTDGQKPFLLDVVSADRPTLVLIGPEGDFSVEEVRLAEAAGFRSVTLGQSRLRTETAALVGVHLMNLKKSH